MNKELEDRINENQRLCLINTCSYILQSSDSGALNKEEVLIMLEILLPKLTKIDRKQVLCQCSDKQFFSEKTIKDRWGVDVEEERNKMIKAWKQKDLGNKK